jgi:hypothetical protein
MFKNTSKFIVGAAAVLTLSMPFSSSFVQASELTCNVPVCDITAQIETLRSEDHNARGMYGIKLMDTYKNSKDITVLKNVYETAKELKALTIEMNDEGWVLRSATDLINSVVLSIAKYSPVDAQNFISLYKELEDQNARFQMISHWATQLETMETATIIDALIEFAIAAKDISISIEDDSWVSRAAAELVSDATIKIIALDPAHEGLYEVKVSAEAIASGAFPFNRVAVLDSSSDNNLLVAFINTKHRHVVYSYRNATIAGNTVKGTFLSNGDLANSFEFVLDRKTGSISGAIKTTYSQIDFSGEQLFSTREVFAGNVAYELTANDVVGKMEGTLAGIAGTISINTFSPKVYSATFISKSGSIVLHFQGKFFAKTGVLSLTSNNEIKLTLSLRNTANGPKWTGASFSTTTGSVVNASFSTVK